MSTYDDVRGREVVHLRRPVTPPAGVLRAPGSKSLTNRALLLAALADGTSTLTGALDADDTRLMVAALARCGVAVTASDDRTELVVQGLGGPVREVADADTPVDVGVAGTVARFLGAVLAASPVTATLDGTARMRERPMQQLFDALVAQGGSVTPLGDDGFLPVTVTGARPAGGEVVLHAPESSQIVSGVVLAALLGSAPTRIVLPEGTPARPYVDMTLALIEEFGGVARWEDEETILVEPSRLTARAHTIEPDASAATYLWALAALHGGDVTVPDLDRDALQGDVAFVDVLAAMGADVAMDPDGIRVRGTGRLRGVDVDLTALPDPGLTLAALALHAEGTTRIRGVEVHRHHESDRIAAAATELRRLGATVEEHADGLTIDPPAVPNTDVRIRTYHDHRMAMAFSVLGEVSIDDPACVGKTWPGWFGVLDRLGMVVG